jgi:Plasmid stabilisation system protein.
LTFKVQIRRAAEVDVAEAQGWYETQRSGLGAEFHSEISQIFTVLTETPLIYPILYRDVRRVLVHRFPYLVWYRVVAQDVTVLACTHARQNPEKVISRLR